MTSKVKNYSQTLQELVYNLKLLNEFSNSMDFVRFEEFGADNDLINYEYVANCSNKIMKEIENDLATIESMQHTDNLIEEFFNSILWMYEYDSDKILEKISN